MCEPQDPCPFHRARNPKELMNAVFEGLREYGAVGLADFLCGAFARVIPPAVLQELSRLSVKPLMQEFGELIDQEDFTPDDLRRLSAVALAMAAITEEKDNNRAKSSDQEKRPRSERNDRIRSG